MNTVVLVISLALVWMFLTGQFGLANLILGAAIAVIVAHMLRHQLANPPSTRRLRAGVALGLLFVREVLISAVEVARLVVSPKLRQHLRPAIVAFPLTVASDAEITLLANLITLTPGTLSLDVSADRKRLYVHVLSLESKDRLIRDIASGFEKRVAEVFR